MKMPDNKAIKITFSFYSDILDQETTEELDCMPVNVAEGYYRLLQFPFHLPKIAKGDIIWAMQMGGANMLTYRSTVEHSGNSTIHVALLDDEYDVDAICDFFDDMGCETEKLNRHYFGMNVPATINYFDIKSRLDELEREKVIDYAESSLSEGHHYRNISF